MHGVKRRLKSSEEVEKERREVEQRKIEKFCALTKDAMEKRSNKIYNKEALDATSKVLEMNSEFYTLWNYRREILEHLSKEVEKEGMEELYAKELQFTQQAIGINPKSYWSWLHRKWVTGRMQKCDWRRELSLCEKLLALDDRNFHCWGYRRYAAGNAQTTLFDEFDFTTKKIGDNFSNYSAWHQRSALLPLMYGHDQQQFRNALAQEFDLVKNAFYTEPADQSAWFYHRWLINNTCGDADLTTQQEEIIQREVEMCDELLSVEPESKWPILTKVFLLLKLKQRGQEVAQCLQTLCHLDSHRSHYYNYLLEQISGNSFENNEEINYIKKQMEEVLERNQVDSKEM